MKGQLQKCNILFGKLCFKHDLSFWRSSEYGSGREELDAGCRRASKITKEEREVEVDAPTEGDAWCVLPSAQLPNELTLSQSLFCIYCSQDK
jgi:hypothetical protein